MKMFSPVTIERLEMAIVIKIQNGEIYIEEGTDPAPSQLRSLTYQDRERRNGKEWP
jgi:hypothetical protein